MKRIIVVGFTFFLIWSSIVFAATTPVLSVVANGGTLSIAPVFNRNHPNYQYNRVGLQLTTAGFSLPNSQTDCPVGITAIGYCLFPASTNQPHAVSIEGPAGSFNMNVCLNGYATGSAGLCEAHTISGNRFAYFGTFTVPSTSPQVASCSMNPVSGVIDVSTCHDSVIDNMVTNSLVHGIALNAQGTLAYVSVSSNGSVYICAVSSSDGRLSECTLTANNLQFPGGVVLNSAGTFAFIASTGDRTIKSYSVEADGTLVFRTSSGIPSPGPVYLAINSRGTVLYYTNGTTSNNNVVGMCSIDPSSGAVFDCGTTGTGLNGGQAPWRAPEGIVVSPSGAFAYIVGHDGESIFYCQISTVDQSLINCQDAGCNLEFNMYGLAINSAGTELYATTLNNRVISGTIPDPAVGTLSACSTSAGAGSAYANPVALR